MADHSEADIAALVPNLHGTPLSELLARPGSVLDNAVKRLLLLNSEHAVSAFNNHMSPAADPVAMRASLIEPSTSDESIPDSAELTLARPE